MRGHAVRVKRPRTTERSGVLSHLEHKNLAKKQFSKESPMVSALLGPHEENETTFETVKAVGQSHQAP